MASNLIAAVEKCDPSVRKSCKSDEEINEWLRDMYIVSYENTWNYK